MIDSQLVANKVRGTSLSSSLATLPGALALMTSLSFQELMTDVIPKTLQNDFCITNLQGFFFAAMSIILKQACTRASQFSKPSDWQTWRGENGLCNEQYMDIL